MGLNSPCTLLAAPDGACIHLCAQQPSPMPCLSCCCLCFPWQCYHYRCSLLSICTVCFQLPRELSQAHIGTSVLSAAAAMCFRLAVAPANPGCAFSKPELNPFTLLSCISSSAELLRQRAQLCNFLCCCCCNLYCCVVFCCCGCEFLLCCCFWLTHLCMWLLLLLLLLLTCWPPERLGSRCE